ncbi:MAG: hypothetical protein QF582_00005, partial [Alphaproteobacteria bacterium]|nr:hypothetical protein [Alphaproteobacteria bacterium]
ASSDPSSDSLKNRNIQDVFTQPGSFYSVNPGGRVPAKLNVVRTLQTYGTPGLQHGICAYSQTMWRATHVGRGWFHLSDSSSAGRGLDKAELRGKPAEMAMPEVLIELAAGADTVPTH